MSVVINRKISLVYMVFVGWLLLLQACSKNDDFGPQKTEPITPIPKTHRVVVINEGNFMWGNASMSVLDIENGTVSNNVFSTKNSIPLGDVGQSLMVHDSLGYVVVNNSGKIEVVDMNDFTSIKTISGFTSPRYMEISTIQPLQAWVTDLYANSIQVVNLETGQIISHIPASGWNETLLKVNNEMLVLNKTDSVINVWDISAQQIVNTFSVSSGIADFKKWSSEEVVCVSPSGVYLINLATDVITLMQSFVNLRNPFRMAVDTVLNDVLFIDGGVFRLSANTSNGVQVVLPAQNGSSWYGVEVQSSTGNIFVTDAKDYVQPGSMKMYSSDFSTSTTYDVGINPQFIWIE